VDQNEGEIGMIAKISLTAAFLLMVAPPMACASNRDAANPAPITRQAHESPPGMAVAQDDQSNADASDNGNGNDNGNDSDSNDSADGNQNADGNQMEQQNADGNDQPIAPQALDAPGNPGDAQQAPRPMNPFSSVAPTDR
jgi:hypothetical protein